MYHDLFASGERKKTKKRITGNFLTWHEKNMQVYFTA